jgi:hypothetical protein
MGSAINRGLTFRMAQTPVQRYVPTLMERVEKDEFDPSSHHVPSPASGGPELYKTSRDKQDGCIKVVIRCSGRPVRDDASSSDRWGARASDRRVSRIGLRVLPALREFGIRWAKFRKPS